jgi:hypothetical protein
MILRVSFIAKQAILVLGLGQVMSFSFFISVYLAGCLRRAEIK